MSKGAETNESVKVVLRAKLNEMPEIAAAAPIELALDFFVVNPKNIRGDDLDPTGFHLQKFVFPFRFGIAREMKLTHYREPRFPIQREETRIHFETVP